jgi:hypothetical protein
MAATGRTNGTRRAPPAPASLAGMTDLWTHSPVRVGPRRAAAVAACAGALTLIAGCGGGSGAAAPLTPRMAITLAADETQRVNTMSSDIVVNVSGIVSETTTGSIQVQLKPTLLAHEDLAIVGQGQTISMTDIVSTKAIYLKSAALSALTGPTGKKWLEIPLSNLSGSAGSALSSLLQNVQNGDPLTQTRMLAASKNVRKVGSQVIDGVATTHYAGTFTPKAAVAQLPASLRKQVAPLLTMITGDIRFDAWIDASHQVRKIAEVETVSGETVNLAMTITSLNKPVHIAIPPAGRVLVAPAALTGGTGGGSGPSAS